MARACLHRPWHLLFCGALESPGRRGNGIELAAPVLAFTSPCSPGDPGSVSPDVPMATLPGSPRSPESCSCSSQRAGTPHYIQIITSALEPWGTARNPSQQQQSPQQQGSPACWGCAAGGGEAAPLLTNKLSEVLLGSFTTGKPNSLDILVVCCEIVS